MAIWVLQEHPWYVRTCTFGFSYKGFTYGHHRPSGVGITVTPQQSWKWEHASITTLIACMLSPTPMLVIHNLDIGLFTPNRVLLATEQLLALYLISLAIVVRKYHGSC